MMQAFRSSAKIIAVVFAVLMLLFLVDLSGITGGGGGGNLFSRTSVGKINGQSVDTRTYQQAVDDRIRLAQQQSPAPLTMDDIELIRDNVWEEFVTATVLEEEYDSRKITVSAAEVAEALMTVPPQEFSTAPDFQTDGEFDIEKYRRWLASAVGQQYVPYLEARYADEIRRQKLLRAVTADVYLSDAALWNRWRDGNETVTVGLTPVIPRTVIPDSAVTVSDEEVRDYYRSHQEELERPATAYLSYVAVPRIVTAADSALALDRVLELRQDIADGEPFEDVATRESSDSVSAADGGNLGTFGRGDMVPPFDSAAFSLPLNTLSQPVLSQFGYHLIEVTGRTADSATARHILVPVEIAGDHRDELDAKADSMDLLGAERLDPAALDTVARALGLPVGASGPVQEGTRLQLGTRLVPDVGIWAFRAQEGEVSHVVETSWAFYLFRLDSLVPEGVPPLSQPGLRANIESEVRQLKKWDAARQVAEAFLSRVDNGATMAQAAEAMGLNYRTFGPFTRTRPPLPNPILVGTAFGMAAGERSGIIDTREGLYVIEVLEHQTADSTEFLASLNEYRAQEIRFARQDRIRFFLSSLRDNADIVDRRGDLVRTNAQLEAEASRLPGNPLGL